MANIPVVTEVQKLTVEQGEGERLDLWLAHRLTNYSRARLAQLIKQNRILVNQQPVKAAYRVRQADQITIFSPEPLPVTLQPVAMELDILYEDDFFLAINKPPGIVVHPGAGNRQNTLVSGLLHYTRQLSSVGGSERPGLVHRLDKDTSGVLLVAKSDEAHWRLSELFKNRAVYKEYKALVWGRPPAASGLIEAALRRSPTNRQKFIAGREGKPARTHYWLEEDFSLFTLLRLQLLTGRTHQARVHLQFIGNPVVGDLTYGGGRRNLQLSDKRLVLIGQKVMTMVRRQLLHAKVLRFEHPWTRQTVQLEAPLAPDFAQVLAFLRESTPYEL